MKWTNLTKNYKNQVALLKEKSPYERLGVDELVSLKDAKKAYKQKMKLYHPDKTDSFMSSHGTEISKLLNEALEKIKENKRNV